MYSLDAQVCGVPGVEPGRAKPRCQTTPCRSFPAAILAGFHTAWCLWGAGSRSRLPVFSRLTPGRGTPAGLSRLSSLPDWRHTWCLRGAGSRSRWRSGGLLLSPSHPSPVSPGRHPTLLANASSLGCPVAGPLGPALGLSRGGAFRCRAVSFSALPSPASPPQSSSTPSPHSPPP